jgi:hypothetical protein
VRGASRAIRCAVAAARSLKITSCRSASGESQAEPDQQARAIDHVHCEGQRDGADDRHRKDAERTIHQHRCGRFREAHVLSGERIRTVHVRSDARHEVTDEGADEEDPQDGGEGRPRSRRQRAEEIDPPERHQRTVDQHETDGRRYPAEVGIRRRVEDIRRVRVVEDECRQANGNEQAQQP